MTETSASTPSPRRPKAATQAVPSTPAKVLKPTQATKAEIAAKAAKSAKAAIIKASQAATAAGPAAAPMAKAKTKTVAAAPAAVAKPKAKLVRDSFTMPQADFLLIDVLKSRALDFKRVTKKSELFRAGLQILAAMPQADFRAALERLAPIKTGRPKKV